MYDTYIVGGHGLRELGVRIGNITSKTGMVAVS